MSAQLGRMTLARAVRSMVDVTTLLWILRSWASPFFYNFRFVFFLVVIICLGASRNTFFHRPSLQTHRGERKALVWSLFTISFLSPDPVHTCALVKPGGESLFSAHLTPLTCVPQQCGGWKGARPIPSVRRTFSRHGATCFGRTIASSTISSCLDVALNAPYKRVACDVRFCYFFNEYYQVARTNFLLVGT
jgi:hypothetical protein